MPQIAVMPGAAPMSELDRQGRTVVRRRVERLDCRERFPLKLPRRAWLPLIPALGLAALALINPATTSSSAQAKNPPAEAKKEITDVAELIRRRIAERRERAKNEDF